eukprot:TRINITY_DN3308_c0_g1_i1.p1 TRINITY_DN3308_c0_g1~~TRINITY_DN3308_c0_g1_i1.p1  ORF type:complete len:477 (-),score=140.48 TRINITY_DN3308_c0_g1_i1:41-1471(-)
MKVTADQPENDTMSDQATSELVQPHFQFPSLNQVVNTSSKEAMKQLSQSCGAMNFGLELATKIVKESIEPELIDAIVNSVDYLAETEYQKTAYDTHFALQEGIYVQISIYRAEAGMGDQVMKTDHWEGIDQLINVRTVDGAPNFRNVEKTTLFGLGQPTIPALRVILDRLTKEYSFKSVVWINLREEPVCYIDGQSYSPREPDTLNINLEYLIGIEGQDLEAMEQRIKADIKAKAFASGDSAFSYYYQTKDMKNELQNAVLTASRIQTPIEVFTNTQRETKIPMEYFRIPITDELAPEENDFDDIVAVLKFCTPHTAIVCNCQMGRGRTTTGLVCAYLIVYTHGQIKETKEQMPEFPEWDLKNPDYRNGEYRLINHLVSRLVNGKFIKWQVDQAIDRCAHFQNLRVAINECKEKVDKNENTAYNLKRGLNYLERYWWLIVFNAYLNEEAPLYKKKFVSWMKGKWGFRRMLKKLDLH